MMAPPRDYDHEGASTTTPLTEGGPTGNSPLAAFPASASSSYGITNKKLNPDDLLCSCCSRRYVSKLSLSPDERSRNDGSRRYFRQFVLDTASDDELEMMLQEAMEQLQDLELLIRDLQNSSEEHAAAQLLKLRTGISISQLMELHKRDYYDRRAWSRIAPHRTP